MQEGRIQREIEGEEKKVIKELGDCRREEKVEEEEENVEVEGIGES